MDSRSRVGARVRPQVTCSLGRPIGVSRFFLGDAALGDYEIYAKRQKRAASAGKPTIYSYNSIPAAFRNQVQWILNDTFDKLSEPYRSIYWTEVHRVQLKRGAY